MFIKFVKRNATDSTGKFLCPCRDCANMERHDPNVVNLHLLARGVLNSYKKWTYHGETFTPQRNVGTGRRVEVDADHGFDNLDELVRNFGPDIIGQAQGHENLESDSTTPLYLGSKQSQLLAVLKLFTVKASSGWTDSSFTKLLELLHELLPEGNTLPVKNYNAKKKNIVSDRYGG